jgi:hypothetical protein
LRFCFKKNKLTFAIYRQYLVLGTFCGAKGLENAAFWAGAYGDNYSRGFLCCRKNSSKGKYDVFFYTGNIYQALNLIFSFLQLFTFLFGFVCKFALDYATARENTGKMHRSRG